MSSQALTLVAAVTFYPADPVTVAYMRNCYGENVGDTVPGRDAAGNYYIQVPPGNGIVEPGGSSGAMNLVYEASAYNTAGNVRHVSVGPSAVVVGGAIAFVIRIRDAADALTDDFTSCQVAIYRLPLV